MARNLTSPALAELAASLKRPVIFFEGEFATGTIRLWTGAGDIAWDSKTWSGVGHFGGLSPIVETGGIKAKGITVTLSGIPSSLISAALASAQRFKPGRIWLGFLDSAGAVVADPYKSFDGRLDVPSIEDGGDTATISINYESRMIDLERPRERRFTSEDQQIDYPGDKGFDFVPSVQEWNGVWGK